MVQGVSLHIGLNSFNPDHYGSKGTLKGCENDAHDMQAIADSQGFKSQVLLTKNATRHNVLKAFHEASKLDTGDIFLVSYSGHGGRIPDRNHDEDDSLDETWCLYDAQLIDDELKSLWTSFKRGVRILIISDSCHSGTILKPGVELKIPPETGAPRFLPYQQAESVFRNHRDFYESIQHPRAFNDKAEIVASVRLLSGCQDNQYSYDGVNNGAFTAALKHTWNNGQFKGNYNHFHRHILAQMPYYQSPNHWVIGAWDREFEQQRPFTI